MNEIEEFVQSLFKKYNSKIKYDPISYTFIVKIEEDLSNEEYWKITKQFIDSYPYNGLLIEDNLANGGNTKYN